MKITGLQCFSKRMKLREPYSISYESVDTCENLFLRISTSEGFTGWGCAAPDLPVTGETAGDVLHSFNSFIEPQLLGRDVFEYSRIMEVLKHDLQEKPSARTMVDSALYDLISQKTGVPLYRLLGGYRRSIPTSVTIGIMPPGETLRHANEFLKQGYRILKIKGGKNVQEDIENLCKLREAIGREVKIRFDANQGYTLEDSIQFISGTRDVKIELFEQPTIKSDLELLKQVTHKSAVPVMADESLLSLGDVFKISKNHCTDLINIKLMKTGGIYDAIHINSVARAAGIGAMVGCMDESALGIAAGLHFTLSRPNIKYADLDGHLDLIDDPFLGMLQIVSGELIPPETPGLGWTGLKEVNL